jgi:hypothetical protein
LLLSVLAQLFNEHHARLVFAASLIWCLGRLNQRGICLTSLHILVLSSTKGGLRPIAKVS